jgi:2-hydroxycyclohexanecarboxyl-CoA dehydrogenase
MFEGKVALVTGGASGIGRGVAERLIAEQASVAIADVARAEEVAREIGAFGVSADVSDEEQVARLVEGVVDCFGRLDFLVNCAGKAAFVPVAELSLDDWQSTLDVHLTGTFLCCRAAIDHLLVAKGRIVNTSSTYAYKGRPGGSIYSAVKAGIVGLTKVLAHELAPDVNVNAIAPGPTDTPGWRRSLSGPDFEAKRAQRIKDVPLSRLGQPEDIAAAVAFLLGPESSWITGSVLQITGGEFML